MKKGTKGEALLTPCQIQATRLNQLEYRRLQRNINLMQDDLKIHLIRLQRQAQNIKYHYTNVVQVVKPNPTYQLWKQVHAYEIAQDNTENWLESIKLKQKSRSKTCHQVPSSNQISSEPVRPLLVLFDNDIEEPVTPLLNLTENFLRAKTTPVRKHITDQQRKNPLWTMLNEQPINSNNPIRSEQSKHNAGSFLPPIIPSGSRKSQKVRFRTTAQQTANLDTLYRIALQNQTAYKPVDQTRIERRKLLDKEFATQHRALKGTIRSAGLVK